MRKAEQRVCKIKENKAKSGVRLISKIHTRKFCRFSGNRSQM